MMLTAFQHQRDLDEQRGIEAIVPTNDGASAFDDNPGLGRRGVRHYSYELRKPGRTRSIQ